MPLPSFFCLRHLDPVPVLSFPLPLSTPPGGNVRLKVMSQQEDLDPVPVLPFPLPLPLPGWQGQTKGRVTA